MPRMDGTGPEGKGPQTGRRMGRCKENLNDDKMSGRGRSRGNRTGQRGGSGKGNRQQRGSGK